jgi:hypothetical protein
MEGRGMNGVTKFGLWCVALGLGLFLARYPLAIGGGLFFDSLGGRGQDFALDLMESDTFDWLIIGFGGLGALIAAIGAMGGNANVNEDD